MASKCTLNNILQSVLSVANQEQNSFYPPSIFNSQFNTVTSLLISALVKEFPTNPQVLDMLTPFIKVDRIIIKNGVIELPKDYRNILGTPMITDKTGDENDSDKMTPEEFKIAMLKGNTKKRPITIIPQAEFALQSTSTYRYPTYKNPIGYFSGVKDGIKQITVAPYDIVAADIMYVVEEKSYVFTTITQPDDTYIVDPNNPAFVESEWGSNAFQPIFDAMTALYSAYSRDGSMRDWAMILKNQGIL